MNSILKNVIVLCAFLPSGVHSHDLKQPPQLWSWFKDLSKSKEACELQSSFILKKLEVSNQIENEYGIYANIKSNRIVVKCIEIGPDRSKLMVAVAGQNRDSVELLRNTIVREIN